MSKKETNSLSKSAVTPLWHIKKTIGAGVFFLSPKMSRWIPEKSTKHRFGKFSKEDAMAFIEVKKIENPDTVYELVVVP